jgi:heavy metal sensor kinase
VRLNSVRMRLALWNVGVLALVLALFGAALRYTNQVRLTAAVDRELLGHAMRLLDGPPRRGRMRPPPPPFSRFDERRWEPHSAMGEGGQGVPFGRRGESWGERGRGGRRHGGGPPPPMESFVFPPRVLDRDGRSLRPGASGPWDREAFTRALRGQQVYSTASALNEPIRVLSVPVRRNGQVAMVVQLVLPLSGVYDELGRLTRTQLTLIPLALLAAALGGAFLTERALRPVRHVTHAAAQIGASDLAARLPVKGKDEFSELSSTFNGMLERLEQAFTQLGQALEQQRRFTADASHELRTPLTIIKANTSLALEEERSGAEYRQALAAADRAADTTNRIVRDLLLLARGDAGQLSLDPRPTRISELLERAAEPFRGPQTPPISFQLPQSSLGVNGDPHHLLRLFTNLLENAVRHTPLTGRITITASAEKDSVVVRVRDTGEGISPEHLPHVCERFYRADAARTRRQGGTGLGLAICQSIVKAHHGSLTLASVVGEGTTVTVRLPGLILLTDHAPAPSQSTSRAGGPGSHSSTPVGSGAS